MRRIKAIIFSVGVFYLGNVDAGSLSFSASAYSVAENSSTISITVNRTGSTAAVASVTVVSSHGTTEAGDFTPVSQSLSWGIGDAAAKKFTEAELLYPQSLWAPRSSLMSAYSYYKQAYYINAIEELNRFIKIYPNHERTDYAYYLLGMCHYEQIADEKKDLGSIVDAKKNFNYVINNFSNSEFALDAEFKLELLEEILASKEMYLAKYYIEREKWIPAINRYKNVVNNYETSIYIEEALHRLVEIHYKIGLIDESKKYAALLGYNYQSSEWYKELSLIHI